MGRKKPVARRDQQQKLCAMPERFDIRLAAVFDAAVIGWHRARMFQDMGLVPEPLFDTYRTNCEVRLREQLSSGEYVGWLASPHDFPEKIVAGTGVQLRRVLPHPVCESNGEITIADGRHAIVLNVFTEPEWRRRGIATLLMKEIIAWAETERVDRLVLHASDEGRALYERLGFVQTNEMRFNARLDNQPWSRTSSHCRWDKTVSDAAMS
jgi:GNAT superfamily N-acetyltransferase